MECLVSENIESRRCFQLAENEPLAILIPSGRQHAFMTSKERKRCGSVGGGILPTND
jgi:hypothetical protein